MLAWGYADSRHRVRIAEEEPTITGFIAEAIQNRLDALDCPPWCDQIVIKDDPPIPGGGRTGRRRWRPDLIFESVDGRKPRPKYYFEAKRLRKLQSINDYVGEDGLGCFLSGRYAPESDEAGMLGYVQCDDVSTWVERLQLAIGQDSQDKNDFLLLSPQCQVQIVEAFPLEWMSKHGRQTRKSIFIHHILLDCCVAAKIDPL